MFVRLNRFWTAEEIQREYRIPEGLFDKLLPAIPAAYQDDEGTPYYLESEIDEFLKRLRDRLDAEEDRMIPPDQARVGGRKLEGLGGYEWRLLDCLLAARDRAVNAQDVIDHVYGHDAESKEGALRQLVKNLTNKLVDQACPVSARLKNGWVRLD